MSFKNLFLFFNPQSSAIAGIFSAAILFKFNVSVFYIFIAGALSFLLCAFAFISNDVLDFEKDLIGERKDKFLISGKISYTQAVFLMFFIWIALTLISFFVSKIVFLGLVALSLFCFLYSFFAQRFPLFKGVYTAFLALSPVIVPYLFLNEYPPLFIFIIVFLYILGREIILDLNDFDADFMFGLKTIPHVLGKNVSYYLGSFCMLLAILFCIFLYSSLIIKSIFCFILFSHVFVFYLYKNNLNIIVDSTRFFMLLMIVILFILF